MIQLGQSSAAGKGMTVHGSSGSFSVCIDFHKELGMDANCIIISHQNSVTIVKYTEKMVLMLE